MDRSNFLWRFFSQTTQRALDAYQEPGPWMTAHISTNVSWPTSKQVVIYQDKEFLLLPSTEELLPAIAMNMRISAVEAKSEARTALGRFASAVSWFEQTKLAIDGFAYGAERPVHRSRQRPDILVDYLFLGLRGLEELTQPRHLRALALYREGLSTSNDFYAALNFYKVIENFVAGRKREEWMDGAIEGIRIPSVMERISAIAALQEKSVGTYLAQEGRGAVAHAKLEDAVDPDADDVRFRFSQDLRLFQLLAKMAIEEFVGVPDGRSPAYRSVNTIGGFVQSQNKHVLAWLRYRDRPRPNQDLVLPSRVSVVAVSKGHTVAVRAMSVARHNADREGLSIELVSNLGMAALRFHFDLRQMELAPFSNSLSVLKALDESLTREMLDELANLLDFYLVMWGNGEVWLIDEESGNEWGRTGQLVPINGWLDLEALGPLVEQLGSLIFKGSLRGE